jgi:hypothetical protein
MSLEFWYNNLGSVKYFIMSYDLDMTRLVVMDERVSIFAQMEENVSTQLHKGIGASGTFINYAVWESSAHFKKAVNVVMNPEDRMSAYPASTVPSPHLFKKVAVQGICVD